MTKTYLLTNIVIVSAIIVICAISKCDGVISDKRLCYDPKCSEPVSMARSSVRYHSIEPHILSFPPNVEITIFSKEAGSRLDLWGAQIHGKRGYVPKLLIREYRTFKSKLTYEVPTEFVEQEVNSTDNLKVDVPSKPDPRKDGQNVHVEVNNTVEESQESENVENIEVEVNSDTNKLENSKDAEETVTPQTRSSNPVPAVPSYDSDTEKSVEHNAEKISEGVQSVTPSYEVIDGTTIPLLDEEVPIQPSYSTQIIAATVNPNEEPILSVHPSSIPPLISRFSKSSSQTIEDNPQSGEANVFAENQTGENDAGKQSIPVLDNADDSNIDKSDISEENDVHNDSANEISDIEIHNGDTDTSKIAQSDENNIGNVQSVISSEKNDEKIKLESSDDFVNTSVDASDTMPDPLSTVENITDNVENKNIISNSQSLLEADKVLDVINENGSVENVPWTDSGSNNINEEELNSTNNSLEVIQHESELEGTIPEHELQDSREHTEYLSEENITDTSKEVDELDISGGRTMINDTEIPLNSQTTKQHDDQLILNDGGTNQNENVDIHTVDEIGVETEVGNSSHGEIVENDYHLDKLNFGSEEVTTELYSNLEEDKLTTARSLLMVEDGSLDDDNQSSIDALNMNEPDSSETQLSEGYENYTYNEDDMSTQAPELQTVEESVGDVPAEVLELETVVDSSENILTTEDLINQVASPEVCDINSDCADLDKNGSSPNEEEHTEEDNEGSFSSVFEEHNYLETLLYLSLTAFTTLLFSLGYYYIENQRRDKELVAKINKLEKELLVTTKESMMLNEGLTATKHKLNSIEDESFGSNEMVLSLKSELEAAQVTKGELEDQIVTLEKELESATEAGLELERMLREFLASQSDENPLAQSVEDLQTRLSAQQAANESLTTNLNLKSQENEALTTELALNQDKCQQLEVEVTRLSGELEIQSNLKNSTEKDFSAKIQKLNKQLKKLSEERSGLITQLTSKEIALNDLSEVLKQQNTDNFDFEKLYDLSHIKAEVQLVTNERDELRIKLTEVEGAHQLLEEHMKLIKEEITSVTEQYKLAERDKTEAQTRLEVLSNYFKEKESQLQKELGMQEAMWVQKQGEVTSTVDRIQTMQNEIQNYRQQIETLKREILDQELEYKSQITALETKSHEQWVAARQSERRLEESKAEASQLRNRLTMVEKSMNEVDSDSKLHRLETNGETASSPQLFMGAETSSSPIIFSGSSGVPPLPPSYMYGAPLRPPFIPPPPHSGGGPMYDISRRPPPLGGRLSSPPPIPLHHPPGRYEDANSPPPPLSPPLHPPYNHRSPPPFSNERIHPHPPPPFLPPLGTSHSWGDEPLPPLRNPVFHPQQREQRVRNHKGSLHSSGDSLDKTNHTGKT